MSSLRWLKLNRTGLCYLPEELASLQKLVRNPHLFNISFNLKCVGVLNQHSSYFVLCLYHKAEMI